MEGVKSRGGWARSSVSWSGHKYGVCMCVDMCVCVCGRGWGGGVGGHVCPVASSREERVIHQVPQLSWQHSPVSPRGTCILSFNDIINIIHACKVSKVPRCVTRSHDAS
jgi:hypothetical protein